MIAGLAWYGLQVTASACLTTIALLAVGRGTFQLGLSDENLMALLARCAVAWAVVFTAQAVVALIGWIVISFAIVLHSPDTRWFGGSEDGRIISIPTSPDLHSLIVGSPPRIEAAITEQLHRHDQRRRHLAKRNGLLVSSLAFTRWKDGWPRARIDVVTYVDISGGEWSAVDIGRARATRTSPGSLAAALILPSLVGAVAPPLIDRLDGTNWSGHLQLGLVGLWGLALLWTMLWVFEQARLDQQFALAAVLAAQGLGLFILSAGLPGEAWLSNVALELGGAFFFAGFLDALIALNSLRRPDLTDHLLVRARTSTRQSAQVGQEQIVIGLAAHDESGVAVPAEHHRRS